MATPLLVACERQVWDDLVSRSGLPAEVFSEGLPNDGGDASQGGICYLGAIAADPDCLSADELERIDRTLFACSGGAFVWLHRFESSADAELESLRQAAEAWARLVSQRKRRHDAYIRPMAILVGGDSTRASEDEFQVFRTKMHDAYRQHLLGFTDVFVMSPRLEPMGKDIFHARGVWPISVSRLMLSLVSRPPTNAAGAVKAWRFKELRRTDAQSLYGRLLPAFTDALFERLRGSAEHPMATDHPAAKVVTSFQSRDATIGQWPSSSVLESSVAETAPEQTLGRLKVSGQEDSRNLMDSAAEAWKTREELLGRFWTGVQERSGEAWAAEQRLRATADLSINGSAEKHLESVAGAQDRIAAAAAVLKDGAAEIELAESWFVQRWFRLAIGLIAASLLGVLFFRGGLLHFRDVAIALMVASGAFVGALLSVSLFYVMESRRGEAAIREWEDRHNAFEKEVSALNDGLVGMMNAASEFAAALLHGTRRSKILRLLSRMTGAAEPVFQSTAVADVAEALDPTTDLGQSPLRYLEASTVALDGLVGATSMDDQDDIDHSVRRLLDDEGFAERMFSRWSEVLERADVHKQGIVDAGVLRRAMSDVLIALPGEIDRIASGSADEDKRRFTKLIKTRLDADDHHERGLFSVELADGVTTEFARHALVSASVEDRSLDDEDRIFSLPRSAASCFPALLIEIASICPVDDVVAVGQNGAREP
jgi:hypothetical protein